MRCDTCGGSGGVQGIPCPDCGVRAVTAVNTPLVQAGAALVAEVRRLLERAERGELAVLLWVAECSGNTDLDWGSVGHGEMTTVVGRLELLKAQLVNEILEEGC